MVYVIQSDSKRTHKQRSLINRVPFLTVGYGTQKKMRKEQFVKANESF